MVTMINSTFVNGKKITELVKEGKINQERLDEIIERTKKGGAEIVKLQKSGSAFYAPAASGVEMAESYLKDLKKQLPCAAYLDGEYNTKDLYAGVPVIIGSNGVEKVIAIELGEEEKKILRIRLSPFKTFKCSEKNWSWVKLVFFINSDNTFAKFITGKKIN